MEMPKDASIENPEEESMESSMDNPKEEPLKTSLDDPKENSMENSMDTPKEIFMETSEELTDEAKPTIKDSIMNMCRGREGQISLLLSCIFIVAVTLLVVTYSKGTANTVSADELRTHTMYERPWVVKSDGRPLVYVESAEAGEQVLLGLKIKYCNSLVSQQEAQSRNLVTCERAPVGAYRSNEILNTREAVDTIAGMNRVAVKCDTAVINSNKNKMTDTSGTATANANAAGDSGNDTAVGNGASGDNAGTNSAGDSGSNTAATGNGTSGDNTASAATGNNDAVNSNGSAGNNDMTDNNVAANNDAASGNEIGSAKESKDADSVVPQAAKPPITIELNKVVEEDQAIQYKTKVIKTDRLVRGQKEVKKKGELGSKHVVSDVVMENGEYAGSTVLDSKVTEKAVTKVVYEGTKLTTSDKGELLVQYATRFLGTKYVLGGADERKGIDCSGFTMRMYGKLGIELPHYSYDQEHCGVEVKYEDAQPGDLILYPGHVGIYMGNNMMIHATPGEVQIKEDCRYREITCVRRIFTDDDNVTQDMFDELFKDEYNEGAEEIAKEALAKQDYYTMKNKSGNSTPENSNYSGNGAGTENGN